MLSDATETLGPGTQLRGLEEAPIVFGGATCRLLEVDGKHLVLNVLIIAVAQRDGLSRCGHGTRLVRVLQRWLGAEAARRRLRGVMVAQVDQGEQATNFWHKQKLRPTLAAAQLLERMHQHDPKLSPLYREAVPMAWEARLGQARRPESALSTNQLNAQLKDLSLQPS